MFKFYPLPIIRIFRESKNLTKLILMFFESPDCHIVEQGDYHTTIKSKHGTIKFWSANKYYGYAHQGEYIDSHGKKHTWNDVMPSRYAVMKMKKFDFNPFSTK